MMSMFRGRKLKEKPQVHGAKAVAGSNHAHGSSNAVQRHYYIPHERNSHSGHSKSSLRNGGVVRVSQGGEGEEAGEEEEAANGRYYIPLIVQTKPLTLAQSRDVESVRLHLRLCRFVYDFNKEFTCQEVDSKRSLLIGLVEYISYNETVIGEELIGDVIDMVKANIFRTLPPSTQLLFDGMDEEEPRLEKSWPHLQIVYEFLLRLVISSAVEDKVMRNYIDRDFIAQLMPLFRSEDCRERDYLKNILHRIYGKYMNHRSFIRKEMRGIFLSVIYERDLSKLIGLAELLEILGSIVNGFALPLKEEHKEFLLNVLIPLHKVDSIAHFHQQLMYCINQYVEKDHTLAAVVVDKLLSFWPVSNSPKQILFLYELEDILEITHSDHQEVVKVSQSKLIFSVQSFYFLLISSV